MHEKKSIGKIRRLDETRKKRSPEKVLQPILSQFL